MNKEDRDNLEFLLSADRQTLAYWYESVSEDDIRYASEIMEQYSKELEIRKRFIAVEQVNLDNLVPDAENYLQKFRLKK